MNDLDFLYKGELITKACDADLKKQGQVLNFARLTDVFWLNKFYEEGGAYLEFTK